MTITPDILRATYPHSEELIITQFNDSNHGTPLINIMSGGEEVQDPDRDQDRFTYSGTNALDKFTLNVQRCIVAIIMGFDPKEQKNISTLFHITPGGFRKDSTFFSEYEGILGKYEKLCEFDSLAAVIAGGIHIQFPLDFDVLHPFDRRRYPYASNNLALSNKKMLGIDTLIVQPKNHKYNPTTNLFFANGPRTIYVVESAKNGIVTSSCFQVASTRKSGGNKLLKMIST